MPITKEHAPAIIVGAFIAGLAIVGVVLAVSGGDGDDTRSIDTERSTTSSSSSTTSSTTTSSTTTTTLAPVTAPPTAPPTLPPPSIIVVPTAPPTSPPTQPPTTTTTAPPTTTSSSPTTSTTGGGTPEQQVADALEAALSADGTLPPDDQRRVGVDINDDRVRATWSLDESLTLEQQLYASRIDAYTLAKTLQGLAQVSEQDVILRATLPDEDGDPKVVVRLVFSRETLNGIDFTTIDPLTIFDLADDATYDPPPDLQPVPPSTTTSSTTSTT